MTRFFIAHSKNEQGKEESVQEHTHEVLLRLKPAARELKVQEMALPAGVIHDLGKYTHPFQQYILGVGERGSVEHAIHGALFMRKLAHVSGITEEALPALLLPILNHHGSLSDWTVAKNKLSDPAYNDSFREAMLNAREDGFSFPQSVQLPVWLDPQDPLQVEMLTRMLLSLLVDSDWQATEFHFNGFRSAQRRRVSLQEVKKRFDHHIQEHLQHAVGTPEVLQVRREVRQSCEDAASLLPGFFRLTVPTGGGKTLSALHFALLHAHHHQLNRVVVATPFTSITDQTAGTLKTVLGQDAVIEHHSALRLEEREHMPLHIKLATENWDAPVVVTTTHQVFESLLARRRQRLRKIHRLARSVLIIDEVQALPTELLVPIMSVLKEMVDHYQMSVVLCSATQPPFEWSQHLGLPPVREINTQHLQHHQRMRRVIYRYDPAPVALQDVVQQAALHPQSLLVVNTRRDALKAFQLSPHPHTFHLSTLMCQQHRIETLDAIRSRLKQGKEVFLVSTQLIEAGVDISFPVGYRIVCPLPSIIQTAGRVNRNGEYPGGILHICQLSDGHPLPEDYLRPTLRTLDLLRQCGVENLDGPQQIERYFRNHLYLEKDRLDIREVQHFRRTFNYPEVAQRSRFIQEETHSLVVPYNTQARKLLQELADNKPITIRQLQPYMVSLREKEFNRIRKQEVKEGIFVCDLQDYDPQLGLVAALNP